MKNIPEPVADTKQFNAASVYSRRNRNNKRDLQYFRNKETATEAIQSLNQETEIFGFTKGQFSLIELLAALLEKSGPAKVAISTWTAANYDVTKVLEFIEQGSITSSRWLVDLTFQRRAPQLAARIRQIFGQDSIRVAQTHAKFLIIQNDSWNLVVRTSMNLNTNPRFEDFTIGNDAELAGFLNAILDELWQRQSKHDAFYTTKELQRKWREF